MHEKSTSQILEAFTSLRKKKIYQPTQAQVMAERDRPYPPSNEIARFFRTGSFYVSVGNLVQQGRVEKWVENTSSRSVAPRIFYSLLKQR